MSSRKVGGITTEELEVVLKNLARTKEWHTFHEYLESLKAVKMNAVFSSILEQRKEDREKGEIANLNLLHSLYEMSKQLLNKEEEERRG